MKTFTSHDPNGSLFLAKVRDETVRIAVWGGGALGLLWSARLAPRTGPFLLVTRTAGQARQVNNTGITLTTLSGERKKIRVKARPAGWIREDPPFDVILVMVKQHHLPSVIPLLKNVIHPETQVLFFQNGWGHQKWLEQLSSRCETYLAVTTEGALKNGNHVRHTGKGTSWIGSYPDGDKKTSPALRSLLETAGKDLLQYDEDIRQRLWGKLAVNCVINPMTAWYETRNGALLHPKYDAEKEGILTEVAEVASLEGISLPFRQMWEQIHEVCRRTSANLSSMLQDVKHHRPTEIDYLNGAIVRLGAKHQRKLPVNQLWTGRIREKEKFML